MSSRTTHMSSMLIPVHLCSWENEKLFDPPPPRTSLNLWPKTQVLLCPWRAFMCFILLEESPHLFFSSVFTFQSWPLSLLHFPLPVCVYSYPPVVCCWRLYMCFWYMLYYYFLILFLSWIQDIIVYEPRNLRQSWVQIPTFLLSWTSC